MSRNVTPSFRHSTCHRPGATAGKANAPSRETSAGFGTARWRSSGRSTTTSSIPSVGPSISLLRASPLRGESAADVAEVEIHPFVDRDPSPRRRQVHRSGDRDLVFPGREALEAETAVASGALRLVGEVGVRRELRNERQVRFFRDRGRRAVARRSAFGRSVPPFPFRRRRRSGDRLEASAEARAGERRDPAERHRDAGRGDPVGAPSATPRSVASRGSVQVADRPLSACLRLRHRRAGAPQPSGPAHQARRAAHLFRTPTSGVSARPASPASGVAGRSHEPPSARKA